MNVELPDTLENFVLQKIADGEFLTPDEVVCAGLNLLKQQETSTAEIRDQIDQGWKQAAAGNLLDSETVRKNLAGRKEIWKLSQAR